MKHLIKAVLAPLLFEMCGIIPLLLVAFGVLNISAGIALRDVLVYQYTPVFFIIATAFFVFSVYTYLKQKNSCNLEGIKKYQKQIIIAFVLLAIFEALLLFLLGVIEKFVYGASITQLSSFWGFAAFFAICIAIFILVNLVRD